MCCLAEFFFPKRKIYMSEEQKIIKKKGERTIVQVLVTNSGILSI